MAILDIYSSGKQKQARGHFANIVKIAKADGEISEDEKALLIKVGKNLNIKEGNFESIIENPEKYPINPPVSYDERIERLYCLSIMVMANGEAKKEEVALLNKIAVGLSFSMNSIDDVCEKAIQLIKEESDLEDFTAAIKKVNKI